MLSTFFANLAGLIGSNISMGMLLVKATIILLVALGVTLSMQRASAGARHLVWLVTVAALLLVPALTAWAPLPVRMLPADVSSAAPSAPSASPNSSAIFKAKDTGAPTSNAGTKAGAPSVSIKRPWYSAMSGISILL